MRAAWFLVVMVVGCKGDEPTTPPLELSTDETGAADTATPTTTTSDTSTPGTTAPTTPDGSTRLSAVHLKSSHNSYERDEALFDQLMYHRVRSLELDIHVDKGGSWPPVAGDWYVHHAGAGDPTTCHRLSDCLTEIGAFHDAVPEHELITVFVDLKDALESGTGHGPFDLDARISARFTDAELFTPAELLSRCSAASELRDAVTGTCGWPGLPSLRGRIAFVLTGGTSCGAASILGVYDDGGLFTDQRIAFVAPTPDDTRCSLSEIVDQHPHVVFANLPLDEVHRAPDATGAGLLTRVWGLNSESAWGDAVSEGVHFLATDKVNVSQDSWARTHDAAGWPFTCIGADCADDGPEPAEVFGIEVDSGDQWGSSDDAVLLVDDLGTSTVQTTAAISVSSSHVEEWAKGCLVARSSTAPDAASFAVCRPADVHPIRGQIRPSDGASTFEAEVALNPPDTVDDDSSAYLRLTVEPDGNGAIARGEASTDGVSWVTLGEQSFAVPLPIQGVSASGHDSADPVRFLFVGTTRSVDGGAAAPLVRGDLQEVLLGGASATGFDGPLP